MVGRTTPGWFPPRPSTYAYALGLYLGDGCLYVPARGSPLLQIRLDRSHPELITEARRAIACLLPESSRVHVYEDRRCFSSCVQASYQHWLEVFPQHGVGRKHNRPIALFCEYRERLGIRWTQSNPRNISVSHRPSVELLDSFVGPKR
jgi:hypothetical protein